MKTPNTNASTALWVRIVVYLIARLTRNRVTKPLVALIQPALDAPEAAAAATARTERDLVIARALHDGAKEELVEVMTRIEGELLLHVGKDWRSPVYRKQFPGGLAAVTDAKARDMVVAARLLEESLTRELPAADFTTRLLPLLVAARDELDRQAAPLQAATDALTRACALELAARHDLRRQYRVAFGELVKQYPESAKKVNAFFRDPGPPRQAATAPASVTAALADDSAPTESRVA